MYNGIIEKESLKDSSLLELEELTVIGTYEEHHPGEEPPDWHGYAIKIEDKLLNQFLDKLKYGMYKGWFALFWNKEDALVVFAGKIIGLKNIQPWQPEEIKATIDHGSSVGIDRKWFDGIRSVMDWWERKFGQPE